MKALKLSRTLLAAIPLAGIALIPASAAAGQPAAKHAVHISANLTVTATASPVCDKADICIVRNHGTGTMPPYGKVTFTTVITVDNNQPPCGSSSQWVNRIVRTITTTRGKLVLHEAGLQCPQPVVGPQVRAVWAVDGGNSTGVFAGASGQGSDIAYPAENTAAPQGTITLRK